MASLKNIMNTDDDQVDSESIQKPQVSASRSSQIPGSSTIDSSYANSGQPSMSTLVSNNQFGSSSRTSRLPAYETPSIALSSRITSGRRRSSTDSTDSRYRPGQSTSSSMSPYASRRSSGEPHVKLTPITKRISKAKKGVPVHVCDRCNKTFTRAEHLRRHQLSHQPPDLPCRVPGCDKVFHRKDLLERHQQRHEQDEASSREGSQSSSRRRNSKNTELSFGTPSRESGLQMPQGFGGHGPSASPDPSSTSNLAPGPWQSMISAPNTTGHLSSPQMQDSSEDYVPGMKEGYIVGPPMNDLQTQPDNFAPGFSEPRAMPNMPNVYLSEAGPAGLSWPDSSGIPSSASGSTYSTPPDTTRRQPIPIRSSSGEWTSPLPAYTAAHREVRSPSMDTSGYAMTYSYATSPPAYQTIYAEGLGIPLVGFPEESTIYGPTPIPTTTVRSLSPQMTLAQSSETLVALPSALSSDRLMGMSSCNRQNSEVLSLPMTKDMMPIPLPRAARDAIPTYLEVYWERVDPQNPIVHKPTFEDLTGKDEEQSQVLRCAMAAVATQYMADKEHRIRGEQLHAYAQYKSELFTQSESWSLQVLQIALLCDYYARYRGKRKESYRPSPRFAPLYQRAVQIQTAFPTFTSHSQGSQRWTDWIEYETHRRLLAACFLLDVHSARYHEQTFAPIIGLDYTSPNTLPIPLSAETTQLWVAETYEAWKMLPHPTQSKTVGNIQLKALTPQDIASAPPFDATILLAASSLYLPRRQNMVLVDLVDDASSIQMASMHITVLFSTSGIANTYMALHYTPLHFLLSVSGDSWVFNKKVMPVSSFTEHQKRLGLWRNSGSAAAAAVFAARALKAFLNLSLDSSNFEKGEAHTKHTPGDLWTDISDYWGVYVCVLICWAFGHTGKRDKTAEAPSRTSSIQWILEVAEMEPVQVAKWPGKSEAHGVVGLVRKELAKDCLGGRNILFADAVRVLEKLEQGGNWKWF